MLVLVTLVIVYGSLYPWRFDLQQAHEAPFVILLHAWPQVWNRFIWRDAGVNVVLYAPFGAAAFRWLRRRMGAWQAGAGAVGLAAALSASMEMLQVYVPGRTCSLLDVVCNVTGAAAGAIAAAIWLDRADRRQAVWGWTADRKIDTGAVVLLACWAGFQWYPFFPALSRTRLHMAVGAIIQGFRLQPVEIFASAAEWLAAGVLVEACAPGMPEGWMAWITAGCLLRLVIQGRVLTLEEVVGAGAALWLWLATRKSRRIELAAGLLAAAILLRELWPFRFAHFPAPFGWMPFVASMGADRQAALIVLLRKAFDYGAMIWLLHRLRLPYWAAGGAVAVALAGGEWMQRYLPGRTAESTDAILAGMLAVVLAVLGRSKASGKYNL